MQLPSAKETAERWRLGMLTTPPIPCPNCGRKTRAEGRCQYCKKKWNEEEMEARRRLRIFFVKQYPKAVLEELEKEGRLSNSWLFAQEPENRP